MPSARAGPPSPLLRGKPFFEYLVDEPEFAQSFNDAMTSVSELAITAVIAGYDFSPYATIVDVGGGHGRLLAAILGAAPHSHGILLDLPEVVAGAPAVLAEHHVADRVRVVQGSFFDAVPEGGDAYVLKNVIHDWPDDGAAHILTNVRKAAGDGQARTACRNRRCPGTTASSPASGQTWKCCWQGTRESAPPPDTTGC